jgi:HlyD family secretion protein
VTGGAVVLAALVFAGIRSGGSKEKVRVHVETVGRRDITQSIKAPGQVQARVKVNISAHVVGKIAKLFVKEGDAISAGQPFLELERPAYTAVRDDARARAAMAATEHQQAEVAYANEALKLKRAKSLAAEGIAAHESLESAELAHESARLRLESTREGVNQAQALLEKAEDDLRKTTIYAPLSGRVVTLNAKEGEVVVSGTMNNAASVIGIIADLSEILVEVDVDETDVVNVHEGQHATVVVDALPDVEFAGKVVEVGSSGFAKPTQPDVQFFLVKVLLERPDPRLRPGMSARATIEVTTRAGALVVPLQAVIEREPPAAAGSDKKALAERSTAAKAKEEAKPTVFVIEAGKAHWRKVTTGISDSTHVEVLEGIREGDRVVTGPYRSLKKLADGDSVKVTDAAKDEEKEVDRGREGG